MSTIIYQKVIRRSDLRTNPEFRYVFGDNYVRSGMGGQAHAMRGEPNAIGVCSKWTPWVYFSPNRVDDQIELITHDITRIATAIQEGRTIVFPTDGVGTGLANLVQKCPDSWRYMQTLFESLGIQNGHGKSASNYPVISSEKVLDIKVISS